MLLGKDCGYICDPEQVNGKFEDFVGVYHRFVHPEICTEVVDQFEKYITTNSGFAQYGKEQFAEKKLGRNDIGMMLDDVDQRLSQHLYQYINTAFENYKIEYDHISRINIQTIGIKLQKTPPGGGYHVWHYENSSFRAANRELAWMIYLNDMPDGEAETEFLFQKKRYKPTTGTLLIWPAGMTHVHRGNTVFTHDKYIATGWFLKLP